MAQGKANASGHRVNAAIDLAKRVIETLRNGIDIAPKLSTELKAALNRPDAFSIKAPSPAVAAQLDDLGCSLWNASIRLDRDTFQQEEGKLHQPRTKLMATIRSFSFSLLGAATSSLTTKDNLVDQDLRLFKTALKAAQSALLSNEADLACRLLEECSTYAGRAEEIHPLAFDADSENSPASQRRMFCQTYLLLRIQHAQVTNNADLAEHFVQKLDTQHLQKSTALSEKAADLFYGTAIAFAASGQADTARVWLLRTLETMNACTDLHFQQRVLDLRLSSTTRLVHHLLEAQDDQARRTAWTLAADLTSKYGMQKHLPAIMLQLDVLLATEPLRRDLLGEVAMQLTSVDIDDRSFKIISRAINKIMHRDSACAIQTLKRFIARQLDSWDTMSDAKEAQHHLESCIVTYTHFLTSSTEDADARSSTLLSLYDSVFGQLKTPLSTTATHATQSLLWRAIAGLTTASMSPWLVLLQHALLHNCSESNTARIQRKAILTFLSLGNSTAARHVFYEMSTHGQNEALSQYLAFKIAVQSDDQQWATACLQNIARTTTFDQTLLYACALEAQQSSKQTLAIETLRALTDNIPLAELTPVLLRCLARLMLAELDAQSIPQEATLTNLANLFDKFTICLESQTETASKQWLSECKWWSRNAYNLGLRCTSTTLLIYLVPLLRACIRIVSHMLRYASSTEQRQGKVRILTCHFVVGTVLITSARHETNSPDMLQRYVEARQEIKKYFDLDVADEQPQRAFQLRRYELEAIIKLMQWQDLQPTIAKCLEFDTDQHWDRLADLALVLHKELSAQAHVNYSTHAPDVLELLQRAVNEMWKKDKNIQQVARWLRTTFSIDQTVNHGLNSDRQVTLKLLDQAAALASRGAQGVTDCYPDEELQWLASASFNRGVDYYIADRKNIAWQLFDAALELARYAQDNGALHESLIVRREEASKRLTQ